ncbi:hypothetical protein AB205_0222100, partial [Aquarana catesbeiana]
MCLFHTQEDLSQEEAVECGSQEEAGLSVSQEKPGTSRSLTESQVPPLCLPNKRARKTTPMQDSALRPIQEASASLRALPTPEEAFACMAATKLQGMQEGQRLLCEQLIYKVQTTVMSGELTPKTDILTWKEAWKEDKRVMALGSVWPDKSCSLSYDHSLGTQMSSAAFRISGTSGLDCPLLDMDSSGHQFSLKIIDVYPG